MKGTPVKSTKELAAGWAPFETKVSAGTTGVLLNVSKNYNGDQSFLIQFEGEPKRVLCVRSDFEATG